MSKKRDKGQRTADVHAQTQQQWFVLAKGESGRVYVEWAGSPDKPPKFNLNFIDDSIAPKRCEHQVVAYHVGHDHGYGYRHRHHFESLQPTPLDDTHVWHKSASLFIADTQHELTRHGRAVPRHLSVSTLAEVMTQ